MGVGRVIARPFVGVPGAFKRTTNRHDYALPPAGTTLLDAMTAAGQTVHAIGKIEDLFAGRGVTTAVHTKSDKEGVEEIEKAIDDRPVRGWSSPTWSISTPSTGTGTTPPGTRRISSASMRAWPRCCRACGRATS